jgi:hypothetical protein
MNTKGKTTTAETQRSCEMVKANSTILDSSNASNAYSIMRP